MTTGSTEFGNGWRIKIGSGGGTETFALIGGEVAFDWTRGSKNIDTASKDDGAYASQGFGSQTVTFDINGVLKLPDAGLQRLSDVSKLQPPITDIEVVKGSVTKYAGSVSVGNFSTSHPNDDKVTWKATMVAAAAPTTDDIGAAV